MREESPEMQALLARAAAGDRAAWGALLAAHQERLMRMAAFRMDDRLRRRVDASDVVQEALMAATVNAAEFFRTPGKDSVAPAAPLFLWLRGVVMNKLLELHRYHLGTRMRDAKRELPLDPAHRPDDTSAAVGAYLTGHLTSPSLAAARVEVRTRLTEALSEMDPTDREVLALRHFEQLNNTEAAQVLGLQERAAAKRYLRALGRLKDILSQMPGGLTEVRL
jgi:RNA polymerase sigma-70 factor (ECF subfamily)